MASAAIGGPIMDKFHCYRLVLKASFVMAFCALVFICYIVSHGSFVLLIVAFGLMGFFTLPLLPAVIENAVEATYPIPEESSAGLLFSAGNILGIGFTVLLSQLVKKSSDSFLNPASGFMMGTIALSVVLVLPYNGQYKRLNADSGKATNQEPLI